jgi:hypothetical protein
LFALPPTQAAVKLSRYITIYPKNAVPQTDVSVPIIFEVSGIPEYLDLRKNILKCIFSIRTANDTAITAPNPDADPPVAGSDVATINYISNTFIRQMKVYLNNKLVYDSNDMYHYRSFIEALFNYSPDVKKTQLGLTGYYEDTVPDGATSINNAANDGHVKRKAVAAGSRNFETLAALHSDIFNQPQYMLPNITMRVELYRNSPQVTLNSFEANANYRLHLLKIEWRLRVVEVSSSLKLTMEKILLHQTAKYPISRVALRSLQLSQGSRDVNNLEIFNGQLPSSMYLTFIPTTNYVGSYGTSPFTFNNFNIESCQAIVGGKRYPSERPLEINFGQHEIAEAYSGFMMNLGFENSFQQTNGISMSDYVNKAFFIGFDFRSDEKSDGAVDLQGHGETRLFMRFREGLPAAAHILVYLIFENILRVDIGRNPILDY